MNTLEKARILGDAGRYDSCGPKHCEVSVGKGIGGIYYAKAEHKTCKMLKTLMDNSCKFDCKYCQNSTSSGCKKTNASYEPEELAGLFNCLNKKMGVQGLFLSSGVSSDPDSATEKMIEAVRIARTKYRFSGYVHFKVLPGTSFALIKEAAALSTRMSINIEAPNSTAMSELSSCKDYKTDILRRQAWISKLCKNQTTQVIVAGNSTDADILKMSEWEYTNINLRRMYFSSFVPIKGTKMENEKAEPVSRQNRLYNVDFLVRQYNYRFGEFKSIMAGGMLPKEDPKLALAKQNFESRVEINEASYSDLIRIPGIGPKTAAKIASSREKITKYEQLMRFGASVERAKPFISVNGMKQKTVCEFIA